MIIIFLAFIAGMPSVFFLTLVYWKSGNRIIKYFLFMQYLFLTFAFARFAFADVIFTYSQLWQSNIAAVINVFVFFWGALLTYTFSGAYLQLAGFRFRGIQRLFFVFISLLTSISAIQPIFASPVDKLVIAQERIINGFLLPVMGLQYLVMVGILMAVRKKKTNEAQKSAINWIFLHLLIFIVIGLGVVFYSFFKKIMNGSPVELIGAFILFWNIFCTVFFVLKTRQWRNFGGALLESPSASAVEAVKSVNSIQDQNLQTGEENHPVQRRGMSRGSSVETAKAMLEDRENTLSLFKIAELSGFASKEALDRSLRKTEGLTAVEFRMKQRKNS